MTPTMNRRRFVAAAGGTVLASSLAGCTDDDGDDDGNGGAAGFEIESGTEIVLDGYLTHWEGVEPSEIDGEENPTLVLEDGGDYEMTWINADGNLHDVQIWDDGDDVVDDLISDEVQEEGAEASISFTASEEMATYVCSYHQTSQVGDLVVE